MQRELRRRYFDCLISECIDTFRSRREYRACERAGSGTNFDRDERIRTTKLDPPCVEGSCNDGTEQWADLWRRQEVASSPRATCS